MRWNDGKIGVEMFDGEELIVGSFLGEVIRRSFGDWIGLIWI